MILFICFIQRGSIASASISVQRENSRLEKLLAYFAKHQKQHEQYNMSTHIYSKNALVFFLRTDEKRSHCSPIWKCSQLRPRYLLGIKQQITALRLCFRIFWFFHSYLDILNVTPQAHAEENNAEREATCPASTELTCTSAWVPCNGNKTIYIQT